jgi:hypothetical protein
MRAATITTPPSPSLVTSDGRSLPSAIVGDAMPTGMTAEQLRSCALDGTIGSVIPEDAVTATYSDPEAIQGASTRLRTAVLAGRVFDLGKPPVNLDECERARKLYCDRRIGHPFQKPYVIRAGDDNEAVIILVVPSPGTMPQNFTLHEFVPTMIDGVRAVVINDTFRIWVENGLMKSATSAGPCIPNLDPEVRTAAFLWLFMLSLLLLAADGVEVERVEPDVKLQRARARSGKPALPAFYRIHGGDYITALSGKRKGGDAKSGTGGTHASPIPHLRRAHQRVLPDGRTVWVRDALVNLRDPHAPLQRAFYARKESAA